MKGVFATKSFTSKTNGSAHEIRQLLIEKLDTSRVFTLNQVHGDHIVTANSLYAEEIPEADGIISDNPDDMLVIRTADCLPVLAYSEEGIIGAFHAGWRSLNRGIIGKGILKMKDLGATSIRTIMGPAIGPCCFRVGDDVLKEFPSSYKRTENDGYFFDLWEMALSQAIESGVDKHMISSFRLCTCCGEQLFNSYRRDKTSAGRQISVIGGKSWLLPGLLAA